MAAPTRKPYPTDLSEKEWTLLEPLVPAVKDGGRPARWERREIANAIFYVVRSGCTWRQLPHDLPPWQTVYYYFRTWRRDGTLEALHARLRHLWVDVGYRGRFVAWVKETLGWSVEVVKHWWTGVDKVWVFPGQEPPEKPTGFQLLKWRWIVERTFAWIGFYRRLSKDYEYLPETSTAMVYTAMSRLMLARLAARTP